MGCFATMPLVLNMSFSHNFDFCSWRVFAGSHDISLADEPHRQIVETNISFIHPGWDSLTVANDLALIKLPQKIEFNGDLIILNNGWVTKQLHISSLQELL
jgi:pantothenate kinase-related protein Tda10